VFLWQCEQTFQESLLAAGAGISLVDSVVMSQSKLLVIFQFTGNTSFNVAISSGWVLLVNVSLKAGVIVSSDISGCSIQSKQRSSCRFCTNSTSWSPCCSKGGHGLLCVWKYCYCCSLCSKNAWIDTCFYHRLWCSSWKWNQWCLLRGPRYIFPFNSPSKLHITLNKLLGKSWRFYFWINCYYKM